MRLTLRYLLAYMDERLEPEEMREIGRKIEESEFASNLLHRIRDVTRRAKLGAPRVVDRKEALDPNTVADYLDNTLPADRVADFEKVCLDSDIQLAEVAGCHQILSLVLGEPAEVNPESRVRMYHLPETAGSQVAEPEPAPALPDIDQARRKKPVERAESSVPEYLREARRRRNRSYFLAVSVLLLAALVYFASTDRLGLFRVGGEPSEAPDQVAMNVPVEPAPPSAPAPAGSAKPSEPAPAPAPPRFLKAAAAAPPRPNHPPAREPRCARGQPAASQPRLARCGALPIVPVTPTPAEPVTPASPRPPEGAPLAPPAPGIAPPAVVAPPEPQPAPDPVPAVEPMAPEAAVGPREVGRLVSAEEIALVHERQSNTFHRIANSRLLLAQDRIVSLPTSRPVLAIDGKLQIQLIDGGEITLLPSGDGAAPDLEIASGRVVINATPQAAPVTITLRAGSAEGALWLPQPSVQVAIEVARADGPIEDPETRPAPAIARLWGVSGEFTWQPSDAASAVPGQAPVAMDLASGAIDTAVELPAWINVDMTSALDRRASDYLRRELGFDRHADLSLRELAEHRQKETRQLALRSLSWIEDFQPMVATLNNAERYAEWPDVIDLLRDSVRRGPRTAAAVHAAMVALQVEPAWTPDVRVALEVRHEGILSRSQATQLVEYLAHETLAMRAELRNPVWGSRGWDFSTDPNKPSWPPPALSGSRWQDWVETPPLPKRRNKARCGRGALSKSTCVIRGKGGCYSDRRVSQFPRFATYGLCRTEARAAGQAHAAITLSCIPPGITQPI